MDKAEKLREIGRIAANPLAFLKYVRIQEPGQLALEYQLWPHLLDFYKQLQTQKFIDLIKAKEIGISWSLAITALRETMTRPGWVVLEISKGMVEAQELLAKSRIVYENLPEWLKEIPEYREPKPNSGEQFGFDRLGSVIQAFPSTESSGIGKTVGRVIHDEADFHDYYLANLGHTRATVADSPERRLVAVSTVNTEKQDSDFQQHWKAARDGENDFKALFYGVFSRPDRDEAWYEQLVKEYKDRPWIVKRNYPRTVEEALSPLSAASCFKKEALDKLWYNTNREPEIRQGFIYILCPPRVGTQYAGGADIGEGIGRDYSCLVILGKEGLTYEVAAVIYTNTLATDLFAYECDKLCREYFECPLAVENNSIGVATLNKLQELGYTNLFSSEADGKRKKNISITGSEKVGWTTGEKNKDIAYRELITAVNDGSVITRFSPMIKEFMELQWINAKPVPTGKTHGDTVMASALSYQMIKQIKALFKPSYFVRGKQIF